MLFIPAEVAAVTWG